MELFDEELTNAQWIYRVLQAAIDHHPRLVAFRFSLRRSVLHTLLLTDKTVVKFINVLQKIIKGYIGTCQSEDKAPKILRALWVMSTSHDIRVLLLTNSNMFQDALVVVLACIRQAWACVHDETVFTTEPSVFFPSEPCLLAYRTTPPNLKYNKMSSEMPPCNFLRL